jgi:serine/threonine protein kinase
VLIDASGHILVTDFGSAERLMPPLFTSDSSDDLLLPFVENGNTNVGTPEYQAPELALGWTHDYAVDVWGFGLLLYLMVYGKVRICSCWHLIVDQGRWI